MSSSALNSNELRFIVIGAGMAGMLAAIRLLESGQKNVTVYEKAGKVGGTWRDNRYPGLFCDVPAHSYTYSFDPNAEWSRYLAPGSEIQTYFEDISKKYDLDRVIQFNQELIKCEFANGCWNIETRQGVVDQADVVVAATGVLHHPRHLDIQGKQDFAGAAVHSACWNDDLVVDGKRVGVIGNGSTGVQLVSALAGRASKVCHFQRTPQWIMPVENPFFSDDQKQYFRDNPDELLQHRKDPELEANINRFSEAIVNPDSAAMAEIEQYVLYNLESNVSDPALLEKLRPNYRAACKRLIYSPDYYQAIQHPNSTLVTEGIERIEEKGVRTKDNDLHELDLIIYASGFHAHQFMRPMQLRGKGGLTLDDVWSDGPTAYLSISIPDCPNFFMLNGPNGPVGNFSLIEVAEQQWNYIEKLIAKLVNGQCRYLAATEAALTAFDAERIEAAKTTVFGSGCQSWYLDKQGVPATWPWSRAEFARRMENPVFSDYEFTE